MGTLDTAQAEALLRTAVLLVGSLEMANWVEAMKAESTLYQKVKDEEEPAGEDEAEEPKEEEPAPTQEGEASSSANGSQNPEALRAGA